jgi:hypothetical protein
VFGAAAKVFASYSGAFQKMKRIIEESSRLLITNYNYGTVSLSELPGDTCMLVPFVDPLEAQSITDLFIGLLVINLYPSFISCACNTLQESSASSLGLSDDRPDDPRLFMSP